VYLGQEAYTSKWLQDIEEIVDVKVVEDVAR
jgi:hypothetical protein